MTGLLPPGGLISNFFESSLFGAGFKPNQRKLEERSHLIFEFPQPKSRAITVFLPMLENCNISENQKANIANYSLIGRAGNLHSYLGANSRSINLSFNINLLHLIEMEPELNDKFKQQFFRIFTSKNERDKFYADRNSARGKDDSIIGQASTMFNQGVSLKQGANKSTDWDAMAGSNLISQSLKLAGTATNEFGFLEQDDQLFDTVGEGINHADIHRNFYGQVAGVTFGGANPLTAGISDFLGFDLFGAGGKTIGEAFKNLDKNINLMIFYINLIRSSVKNKAKNTTYGPPVVRLTHGPMYNNIPCIVENYSIQIVNDNGYDVGTLMPRNVTVQMTLTEIRTSENFRSRQVFGGDGITGWESVLSDNNMDPYNGEIAGIEDVLPQTNTPGIWDIAKNAFWT